MLPREHGTYANAHIAWDYVLMSMLENVLSVRVISQHVKFRGSEIVGETSRLV